METYEKKYKEALENFKLFREAYKTTDNSITYKEMRELFANVENSFPELIESDDERLRKELLNAFKEATDSLYMVLTPSKREAFIAWLEKQGEQKPADLKIKAGNWYICGMEVMNENMVTAFHRGEIYYCPKDGYLDVGGALFEVGCLDVFRLATEKEIPQPKQEWSEENEEIIEKCIEAVRHSCYSHSTKTKAEDWLNSLKDRYAWKPSDEQMHYLSWIANIKLGDSVVEQEVSKHLNELLEDLKKLREE